MRASTKIELARCLSDASIRPAPSADREDGHIYSRTRSRACSRMFGRASFTAFEVEADRCDTLPDVALPIVVGLPDADVGQALVSGAR